MKKILFITFILILHTLNAYGEYIDPSQVQIETKKYPTEADTFVSARYVYEINWQGIPVGKASVEVLPDVAEANVKKSDLVKIKAEAQSAKVIDVFYKLRHQSESTIDKTDFSPIKFQTWQKENSKTKFAQVKFSKDGRINSFTEKDGSIEKQNDFKSDNFTLDPLSAAFFARSIPIKVGTQASFDVFNGKHRYLITFDVVEEDELTVMGSKRKAFKAVPTVKKLTDTDGETRLTAATIWISADEAREVLRLESKVFVGSVGASLVKVESIEKDVKLAAVQNSPKTRINKERNLRKP